MIYRKKQYLGNVEEKLSADIIYGEGKRTQTEINDNILNQIPTNTATGETINVNDSANLPLANFEMLGNATQADIPTPTTPQDIHVVTGDSTVTLVGKNLFDGLWGTNTSTNFIRVIAGLKYIYSESGTAQAMNYRFYTSTSATEYVQTYKSAGNYYEPSENGYVILYKTNSTKTECQLEIGSTITPYVAYQGEQTVTLPLGDIELAKIGDYADRIYKDNGKWYVYKAIGEYTLPTRDSLATANINGVSTKYIAYANSSAPMRAVGTNKTNEFLSDRNAFITDTDTTFTTYPAYRIAANIVIVGPPNDTLENFNATVVGTKVKYALATPTTTEITDTALITALEQVLAMTTYKTTTNAFTLTVSDNATPTIVAEYRQDIGTLISNLNNAILSLGNNV